MPLLTAEANLALLRMIVDKAADDLDRAVGEYCPGPHNLKQHRDRKKPWCETCGRDARGVVRKKLDSNQL